MKKILLFLSIIFLAISTKAQTGASPVYRSIIDENVFLNMVYKGKTYRLPAVRLVDTSGGGGSSCSLCDYFIVGSDSVIIGEFIKQFEINADNGIRLTASNPNSILALEAERFEIKTTGGTAGHTPSVIMLYDSTAADGWKIFYNAKVNFNSDVIGNKITANELKSEILATFNVADAVSYNASGWSSFAGITVNSITANGPYILKSQNAANDGQLMSRSNKLYFNDGTGWKEVTLATTYTTF